MLTTPAPVLPRPVQLKLIKILRVGITIGRMTIKNQLGLLKYLEI